MAKQSKSTPTELSEDYPGQRITGPDYDTRDREAAAANRPPVTFTAAEQQLLGAVAFRVFEEIAGDVLADTGSISRADAIELALDAGRFEQALARRKDASAELRQRVEAADYQELIAAVGGAFRHAEYGR